MTRVFAVLFAVVFASTVEAQIDVPTNAASCLVSTGYNASDTSIVVATGCGASLPTAATNYAWCQVTDYSHNCHHPTTSALDPNYEIVRCTRSADTLTCTRAQESTSASTKNTGGKTYWLFAFTAKTISDINTALGAPFAVSSGGSNSILTNETTTPNFDAVSAGGTATRGTTNGTNYFRCFNGTPPAGTLTNGADFYCDGGEARVMDAGGNWTQISPHDDVTNEYVFFSVNTVTGQVLRIDMERLMRRLDALLGGGYITEFLVAPGQEAATVPFQGRLVSSRLWSSWLVPLWGTR